MMPFKHLFGMGNRKKSGQGVHFTLKCQSCSVVSLHVRHCAMVYCFGDLAKGLVFSSKLHLSDFREFMEWIYCLKNDFNIRDEEGGN